MSVFVAGRSIYGSPQVRLAAGGWIFFVAENAILSENRTALIDYMGHENYHLVYGAVSTAATASIGYAYYKISRGGGGITGIRSSPLNRLTSFGFLSVGLILASQALPKMQIPFMVSYSPSGSSSSGLNVQARCPFDFADQERTVDASSYQLFGMERVTRHPGLWSLALVGAGNALLHSHPALRVWWYGPSLVAWLGGAHSDSRFRRGMGGALDPWYESQTSNLPFAAMVSGKQGAPSKSFCNLLEETKLFNACCAIAVASMWILSRGRAR